MIRDDVCYLVAEDPEERGIFETKTRTERMVFCSVRSVGSSDFWRARTAGVDLTIVFVLSDFIDYHGEKLIRYGEGDAARYYGVVRTYVNDSREIEITCEEAKAYVGQPQDSA